MSYYIKSGNELIKVNQDLISHEDFKAGFTNYQRSLAVDYIDIFRKINAPNFDINDAKCTICTAYVLYKLKLDDLVDELDVAENYRYNPEWCTLCPRTERDHDFTEINLKTRLLRSPRGSAVFKYRDYTMCIKAARNFKFDVSRFLVCKDKPHFKDMLIYQDNHLYRVPPMYTADTWALFIAEFPSIAR